jgi:hypothetical protein
MDFLFIECGQLPKTIFKQIRRPLILLRNSTYLKMLTINTYMDFSWHVVGLFPALSSYNAHFLDHL